jgi:AcrR family transcriptional regulator
VGRAKTIADEKILRLARQVFREGGHAASTRDIARAAGISQGVLFQRFGSKEALFLRAMTPEQPDLDKLLGPYPPARARTDLKRIAERLVEYLGTLAPTLLHVLANPALDHRQLRTWHDQLPFAPVLSALTARFKRLKRDGLIGPVDPAASAQLLLAAAHAAALLPILDYGGHHKPQPTSVQSLVTILWTGLAPNLAGPPAVQQARSTTHTGRSTRSRRE